jgi:hypothetical protein
MQAFQVVVQIQPRLRFAEQAFVAGGFSAAVEKPWRLRACRRQCIAHKLQGVGVVDGRAVENQVLWAHVLDDHIRYVRCRRQLGFAGRDHEVGA